MTYLSICSGIEAASVAWHPLGWQACGFSEIAPFQDALLKHHYPTIPNFGDMTKHHEWPRSLRPDLIVGGTPCQAFSVSGLRKGLADPRGNLTLLFLGLLERYLPRWVVWENVPGVLSDETGAFGAFLGGLAELVYGFAYRVLDAQFVRVDSHPGAVPQRRRRVFVVGYLGDWRPPAAILFEPQSLRGNPPPRREAGQIAAGTLAARTRGGGGLGTDFECAGGLVASQSVCPTLRAGANRTGGDRPPGTDVDTVESLIISRAGNCCHQTANTLRAQAHLSHDPTRDTLIAFSGRNRGDDGRGYDRPPQIFQDGVVGTVDTVKPHCVAVFGGNNTSVPIDVAATLNANRGCHNPGDFEAGNLCVTENWTVRRLTPRECERLQGFPDDYTLIPYGRNGRDAADGPRYAAIGNSMAVNVMSWIGQRIAALEAHLSPKH